MRPLECRRTRGRETPLSGGTWKSEALGADPSRARGAVADRSRARRAVGAAAILACPPLAVYHAQALADTPLGLTVALGLGLGFLAADLVTGLVHWACDTWGDEQTRGFGELIRGFREHHRDPEAMLAHDWIEVNLEPAVAATLAFVAMALPPLASLLREHAFVYAFAVSLVACAGLANQLHQWAHAPRVPRAVRALQRSGWLSPERHAIHHRQPYDGAYCITSGLLNRPLDAIGFWRALERGIGRASGLRPRDSQPDRAARLGRPSREKT